MKRTLWTAAGMVAGVAGTVWTQRQVRQQARRLAPDQVASSAALSLREAKARMRRAIVAGQQAREQREEELWQSIHTPPVPGRGPLGEFPPGPRAVRSPNPWN
jgi:hypothetical protein